MSFEKAVRATPSVSAAYEKGLRALREVDRNRITAGGVTAGMDFGLALVTKQPTCTFPFAPRLKTGPALSP